MPFSPSCTKFTIPPTGVHTGTAPTPNASIKEIGKPSYEEHNAYASAAFRYSNGFFRSPSM